MQWNRILMTAFVVVTLAVAIPTSVALASGGSVHTFYEGSTLVVDIHYGDGPIRVIINDQEQASQPQANQPQSLPTDRLWGSASSSTSGQRDARWVENPAQLQLWEADAELLNQKYDAGEIIVLDIQPSGRAFRVEAKSHTFDVPAGQGFQLRWQKDQDNDPEGRNVIGFRAFFL